MTERESVNTDQPNRTSDLHDVIDDKIRVMVDELHAGGWNTEEIVLAVNDVINTRWMARIDETSAAPTMNDDFVSDGNEG